MPRRQRLLHRPWATATLGVAIAGLVRALAATGRWRIEADSQTRGILERGEPAIGAFWHSRLILVPRLWRRLQDMAGGDRPVYAMVSMHGDGQLIASALDRLGIPPIRGSTGKSGAKVLRIARAEIARGACMAIAVDGPRGPAGEVQPGATFLARQTGAPVIPLTGSVRPHWRARSWDRLLVPLPFSRGVLIAGAPMRVPKDSDAAGLERFRRQLTGELDRLTALADARAKDGA